MVREVDGIMEAMIRLLNFIANAQLIIRLITHVTTLQVCYDKVEKILVVSKNVSVKIFTLINLYISSVSIKF